MACSVSTPTSRTQAFPPRWQKRLEQVEEKAFAYLEAGTQLVWVLKPRSKTVTVYRSETNITLLTRDDTLTGEEVIKGFSCQVAELFE